MEDYLHVNYVEKPLSVKHFSTSTWKYTVIRIDSSVGNVKVHIPGSYQCNQYDKAFSIDNDLKVHMYEHFDEKPCQCNQCDKSFSMHSDLKKTHV